METDRRDRLDALARLLGAGPSRRGVLRLLSGVAIAGPLSLLGVAEGEANKKGKKKRKKGKKRRGCAAGTDLSAQDDGCSYNAIPIQVPPCIADETCGPGQWCNAGACEAGCNSHTHCDDCRLCDIVAHRCCFFTGNVCGVASTCPND